MTDLRTTKRRWFSPWFHAVWPVIAAWVAYDGGWMAVLIVATFAGDLIVSDRLIYWQRQRIDEERHV